MIKRPRYLLWLLQGEADLRSVDSLIDTQNFAQACFYAQQASEKCLKAVAYFRGSEGIKAHSLAQIARELGINDEFSDFAAKLDLYYISARYPDALPEGCVPSEEFTLNMAREARQMAGQFVARAKGEVQT